MDGSNFFVAHEFATDVRDDLRSVIKRVVKDSGYVPVYADDEVGSRQIFEKIKTMIENSEFVVCDVSNATKSNVFLELGYAIAAGKRCYLICRAHVSIPADLAGIDRIEYESYEKLAVQFKLMVIQKEIQMASKTLSLKTARYNAEDAIDEDELFKTAVGRYKAVELYHRYGTSVTDTDSTSGSVWRANFSEVCAHLIFGPYLPLDTGGKFRAFFKLKLSYNGYSSAPAFLIDIWGAGNANRAVWAAEFKQPNKYQLFSLDFQYSGVGVLEYRIYNMTQRGSLWVDYVAVVKIEN